MRRYLLATLIALVVVACAGCTQPAVPRSAEAPFRLRYPGLSGVETTIAPPMEMREFRLPLACSLADYTSDRALLAVNTGKEFPSAQLAVLDLATGRHSLVVCAPVNIDPERFDILGYRMSDGYVAWEEVSPGETDRSPDEVFWRLYVAELPAAGSLVTSPTLVDGGRMSERSRPMFGFSGDDLVWMANENPPVDGTRRGYQGVVRLRAPSGDTRELMRTPEGMSSFSVSAGAVTVAYRRDGGTREAIRVVDPRYGSVLADLAPENLAGLQHWPAYRSGALAFTIGGGSPAAPVGLYVRRADGTMRNLGTTAMDPCFAGDYLFFERDTFGPRPDGKGRRNVYEITGTRVDDEGEFPLVSTDPVAEGAWQTSSAAAGYKDVLVIYNNQTGFATQQPRTLVRVYRGLGSSETTGEPR